MLILGLLLLALIYSAYLYGQNQRLRDENEKLARWNRRLTKSAEEMVAGLDRLDEGLDNLLPLGNVDLAPPNVVAFPGREEPPS